MFLQTFINSNNVPSVTHLIELGFVRCSEEMKFLLMLIGEIE